MTRKTQQTSSAPKLTTKPWLASSCRIVTVDEVSHRVPGNVIRNRRNRAWTVKLPKQPTKSFADIGSGGCDIALRMAIAYLKKHWSPVEIKDPPRKAPSDDPFAPGASRIVIVNGVSHEAPRYINRLLDDAWTISYGRSKTFPDAKSGSPSAALDAAIEELRRRWKFGVTGRAKIVHQTQPWDPYLRYTKVVPGVGTFSVPRHVKRLPDGWQMTFTKPSQYFGDVANRGAAHALRRAEDALKLVWSPEGARARMSPRIGGKGRKRNPSKLNARQKSIDGELFTVARGIAPKPSVDAATAWDVRRGTKTYSVAFSRHGGARGAYDFALKLLNADDSELSNLPWEFPNTRSLTINSVALDVPSSIYRNAAQKAWVVRMPGGQTRFFGDAQSGSEAASLECAIHCLKGAWNAGEACS